MPKWNHHLRIKELWAERAEDDDAQAKEIAPEVAIRINRLAKQVKDEVVAYELETIAEQFEDVPSTDSPQRAFNYILSDLYDLGDRERIWIG